MRRIRHEDTIFSHSKLRSHAFQRCLSSIYILKKQFGSITQTATYFITKETSKNGEIKIFKQNEQHNRTEQHNKMNNIK